MEDLQNQTTYTCPMHPEVKETRPGSCPICGMRLVPMNKVQPSVMEANNKGLGKLTWKNYIPLFVIISLIFLTSLAIAYPTFDLKTLVRVFMAGFFLVFAGFKLIDLRGFAEGYSTYDLLAKKWFSYGYIYPFIEVFFGLSMIIGFYEAQILWLEIIVMTFSGVGVLFKLMKGEKFQCYCLGTFLKVPLTKITLVEDFGMVALAAYLLFSR